MASSLREAIERAPYNTARWQRLRKDQLAREPLCAMCLPRCVPATICDHVEPHKGNLDKFWAGPFQSLCKMHHDSDKKRIEHGRKPKPAISIDGWPVEVGGGDCESRGPSNLDRTGTKTSSFDPPVQPARAREARHGK